METNQKTDIVDLQFPVVIFPEEIRKIIDDTHEELNYPVSFISASLLFAVSVAIGNCRTLVSSPSKKARAILFMALLGDPGTAKTHAINFALAPFLELDDQNLAKYNAALQEWRKQSMESRGDKPEAKQLCVQDFTMEAITKILSETKRGIFVFVDELRGWILSFNKYRNGGGDLEQWLSLFNGCPITVNRKTLDDITFVRNPFVSVIGGLQPGLLPKLFGGEKMDNGFFTECCSSTIPPKENLCFGRGSTFLRGVKRNGNLSYLRFWGRVASLPIRKSIETTRLVKTPGTSLSTGKTGRSCATWKMRYRKK